MENLGPHVLPTLETRIHGDFVDWLAAANGSIAVTTYNSGKLALISAANGRLDMQIARHVRPMGIAYDAGRLAIATRDRIFVWRAASEAQDAHFELSATHITGRLDAHELAFDARGLVFANTRFNCVARPSDRTNFRRSWTPAFIGAPERPPKDCCHLNGIGIRRGRVAAVTAFCMGDQPQSWRGAERFTSGVLLEVPSGARLAANLCLPHSPRWNARGWWFCNSGEGTLCRIAAPNVVQTIAALPGFTRGLAFAAGRAVVGLSRIRKRHILDAPPVRERFPRLRSGLWLVDPATGRTTGALEFVRGGREVFDVAFLPGISRIAVPPLPPQVESQ